MSRFIFCVSLMLCCLIMSGCRVCSSPYLYCGPVDDMSGDGCGSCGGSSCDPLYRSGSALNGYRGGVYHDGYYTATAHPIPYNDEEPTPLRQVNYTQNTSTPRQNIKSTAPIKTTPAREVPTSGRYSAPSSNLPSIQPPSLSREMLLQQERGVIDAKIIDVQYNVYPPQRNNQNSRSNRPIRQVVFEDVQF